MSADSGCRVFELTDRITDKYKQLEGIKADQIVLKLAESGKELEPMQTLGEAGVRSGTTLVVAFTGPGDAWALPPPLPSEPTRVGDTDDIDVYRTTVVKLDGREWPFFLTKSVYHELLAFVRGVPGPGPRVMMLTGPVKSGKTDVLHLVLPSLIAREYAAGKTCKPCIMRFTFDIEERPDMAAERLVGAAKRAAATLGITLKVEKDQGWAMRNLGAVFRDFAKEVAQRGGRLWLLMDECQAPLLASTTHYQGKLWMSAIKSVVAAVAPVGRVALTGSAMVTFLNEVRLLPTQGFMLIASVSWVQLGVTPSDSAAAAMATELGQAYAAINAWPKDFLETNSIVRKLTSEATGGLLNARPALVSHVLDLMSDGSSESAEDLLDAAVASAKDKLRTESRNDFVTALRHRGTSRETRRCMFQLGNGKGLQLNVELNASVVKLLKQLCEPCKGSALPTTLLPPYGAFVKESLNEEGDVIVRRAVGHNEEDELGDKLRGILNVFADGYKFRHFRRVHLRQVSAAVAKCLHAHGIGVENASTGGIREVSIAEDIAKVAVLHALLHDPANSSLAQQHVQKLGDEKALPDYSAAIGFHVLRWARNVASHHGWAAGDLQEKGLSVPVVDAAARAAAKALCDCSAHDGFAFVLSDKGIPSRVPE